jgi:Tfp pilus assembly protein PilF
VKRFRFFLALGLMACAMAAAQERPQAQEPPEEDEALREKEYSFNPLQASKELKIGLFYLKKGSLKAAANRFAEATKWDPTSAEAWLKLGETRERLKDKDGAREAYAKYLEAAPDAKNATAIKKKIQAR